MRQGGEPQGVQVVRQGEPTPYHCDFNPLYFGRRKKQPALARPFSVIAAKQAVYQPFPPVVFAAAQSVCAILPTGSRRIRKT